MDRDGNNDDYIKTADEVLTVNQWHQIGFTHGFNSGSFMETKIYLDGVEQATTVGNGKMPSGSILNVPAAPLKWPPCTTPEPVAHQI